MKYVSTRGGAAPAPFDEILLAGPAPDGGLYVPTHWPTAPNLSSGASYHEMVAAVAAPFMEDSLLLEHLPRLAAEAYAGFGPQGPAPLREVSENRWLLDLTSGPTLSFKDYALQMLGRLFNQLLELQGKRILVLGATSGDTGSAAIEACRDQAGIDIVILYPEGRVSDIQRRQMTTVESSNVHTVAVEGTFDDCQDLVKAAFSDAEVRRRLALAAVNSINWAPNRRPNRLLPVGGASARAGDQLLGPHRQLRQRAGRMGGAPDGRAGEAAGGGQQPQPRTDPAHL